MNCNTFTRSLFLMIICINSLICNIVNSLKHSNDSFLRSSYYHFDEVLPIFNQGIEPKTLSSFTKKLLRKTYSQNENLNNEFKECYEKLSNYIRFLQPLNKKERKTDPSTVSNLTENLKKSYYQKGYKKNLRTLKIANILYKELNIFLLVYF